MTREIRTSLLAFADFAGGSEHDKLRAARQHLRPGSFDPWREVKHAILRYHRDAASADDLRSELAHSNVRSVDLAGAFDAYLSWLGNRRYLWRADGNAPVWSASGVSVRAGTDVGIVRTSGRQSYLLKLYFRKAPIGARRAETVNHLLAVTRADDIAAGVRVGVLDVMREQLYTPSNIPFTREVFLQGEAAAFRVLVEQLRAQESRSA